MVTKKYLQWRKKWTDKLDIVSSAHINCIRIGRNETWKHKLQKLKSINTYKMFDFMTEVYDYKRKYRADIIIFMQPMPLVIEVAVSEKESTLKRKSNYWTKLGFAYTVKRA